VTWPSTSLIATGRPTASAAFLQQVGHGNHRRQIFDRAMLRQLEHQPRQRCARAQDGKNALGGEQTGVDVERQEAVVRRARGQRKPALDHACLELLGCSHACGGREHAIGAARMIQAEA
jgi:hypothetical protein